MELALVVEVEAGGERMGDMEDVGGELTVLLVCHEVAWMQKRCPCWHLTTWGRTES